MRSVRLDVSGNTAASGVAVNPPGTSYHADLFDNSDTTYVDLNAGNFGGGNLVLTFDDITLAAGEQVKTIVVTERHAILFAGMYTHWWVTINDDVDPLIYIVNSPNALGANSASTGNLQVDSPVAGSPWTQAKVNAIRIGLNNDTPINGKTPASLRMYALFITATILAKPVVSAVGPSGTSVNSKPAITWTFTGDAGEPQTWYRVKVFTAAAAAAGGFDPETSTPTWDSLDVNSSGRPTVTAALPDDSYKIYVKAAQAQKHWSDWKFSSVTVEHGPDTPTLSPASGTAKDTAGGLTVSWTYSHGTGLPEGSWALRRSADGGSYQYWNDGSSSWGGTLVWNTGTATSKVFGAGKWPNGHTYSWSVSVRDNLNVQSPFANDSVIVAVAPPSATITAPTGTDTSSSRPAVHWSFSDGASRPQVAFQVKVFLTSGFSDPDSSTPLYDSGVEAGSQTGKTPDVDFPTDGTGLTAAVKVKAGEQWSDWDTQTFNISITPPNTPTLTAVEATGTNSVLLTATGGNTGGTFTSRTHAYQRKLLPSTDWEDVRFGTAVAMSGGVSSVNDQEVVAQKLVQFRVKAVGVLSGGGIVASPWSDVASRLISPTVCWLKDVQNNLRIKIKINDFQPKRKVIAGVYYPAGRTEAVVVSEEDFRGMTATLDMWVLNQADVDSLITILKPGKTLLIQDVLANQWYVRISSDLDLGFLVGVHATLPRNPGYRYQVPVTEVARPDVS